MKYDRSLGRILLARTEAASTNHLRGSYLEKLVQYLLTTQAGFDVSARLIGLDAEHDLLVRGNSLNSHLHAVLGDYLLVECKNTRKRVSARDVKVFATNVRSAQCHAGILATTKGISGSKKQAARHAWFTVRKMFHRDQAIVIVLDLDDLDDAVEDGNIAAILLSKYETIRFDLNK